LTHPFKLKELANLCAGSGEFMVTLTLLYDMDEDVEKEGELEAEIQRFERWAEAVRPKLTDPNYEPEYQELRLAVRVLGIRATIYPTQGDWPFRCDIVATVPEIAKKLDCFNACGQAMFQKITFYQRIVK